MIRKSMRLEWIACWFLGHSGDWQDFSYNDPYKKGVVRTVPFIETRDCTRCGHCDMRTNRVKLEADKFSRQARAFRKFLSNLRMG